MNKSLAGYSSNLIIGVQNIDTYIHAVKKNSSRERRIVLIVVLPALAVFVLVVLLIIWVCFKKKKSGVLLSAGELKWFWIHIST